MSDIMPDRGRIVPQSEKTVLPNPQQQRVASKNSVTSPALFTVVENVYYQSTTGTPHHTNTRYQVPLQHPEQVYTRHEHIGSEWKTLDFGWIKDVLCVLLVIPAPRFNRVPTPGEREKADAGVVEVFLYSPQGDAARDMHSPPRVEPFGMMLVKPGRSLRIEPGKGVKIMVRAVSDTKLTVNAFPA